MDTTFIFSEFQFKMSLISSVLSTTKTTKWIETMINTQQLETELGLGFYMVACEGATWR